MSRDYDLVIYGATGFTGRLVAEYISQRAEAAKLRWAIGGRDRQKLTQLGFGVPIVVADAHDPRAIRELAESTRVVCTTAGPYARYGSELVAACAEAGTHYCDLTGEVPWMRRMIDAYHSRARASGARIVHTCGFDSIPSDLGTWAAQAEAVRRWGAPARKITALFGEIRGGMSGGTVASAVDTLREGATDRSIRTLIANPYGLDPDPAAARPKAPDERGIGWERHLKLFTVPFVMAQVNSRVVRRAHALAGLPWGSEFVYREAMSTPGNLRGAGMAVGVTGALGALAFALTQPALRDRLIRRAPKPGEGPAAEVRARGHWTLRLVAEGAAGTAGTSDHLVYEVSDRADPGYGSTAKMLGESALCLALDRLTSPGGVLTPSVAMGGALLDRLRATGLAFAARS